MRNLDLVEMIRMAAVEAGYNVDYMTDEYVKTLVGLYSNEEDKNKFLLATPNGFICGLISEDYIFLPGVKVALEVSWWVHPSARGNGEGSGLYNIFVQWAKDNGCKVILQGKKTEGSREISRVYMREI